MNLFIDNNDGRGQQDYTAWVDVEHLPKIARKLNRAATMTASLVNCGPGFTAPVCGARVILQCGSGLTLFTGYLATAPEQQYLGLGHQGPAWRYTLAGGGRLVPAGPQRVAGADAVRLAHRRRRAAHAGQRCAARRPGPVGRAGCRPGQPVPYRAAEHVDGACAGADDDDARDLSRARRQARLPAGRPAELHHQRPGRELCAGGTDAGPAG